MPQPPEATRQMRRLWADFLREYPHWSDHVHELPTGEYAACVPCALAFTAWLESTRHVDRGTVQRALQAIVEQQQMRTVVSPMRTMVSPRGCHHEFSAN